MPKGRPVDAQTRARMLELFAEGKLGRNAIARELGVAGSTVTLVAKEVGHEFNWEATELAVRAHSIQAAQIRSRLAQMALLRAAETLEAMDAPTTLVHYQATTEHDTGGWKEHVLDTPTIADQRNLATTFGILVSRASDLMRSTEGAASAEAVSMLDTLAAGIEAAARALEASDASTDPTAEPANVSRDALLAELDAVADEDPGHG